MRIGLDGMPLAQPLTGVGRYTFELGRALASTAPRDQFELVSPLPFEQSVFAEPPPANLALVYSKPNVLQRRWWTLGLPSYMRRHSFDLFHGTNYEVPLRGHCPTIVTIHDLSLLLHSSTHDARAVRRARLRLPLMARRATMIVTPSELVRGEVCEHLGIEPERVVATPLAPRGSFKPMSPAETVETLKRLGIEDEFLLFVGTIEPRKNLLTLLRAFEEILRTTSLRPQLVVAGKTGWKSDRLLSQLESERVRLIGFVPDEDLRALYSSCRAFIYPSVYEGFGLPPLEAMACGAPVIASRVPSVEGSNVPLFSAEDFVDLARSVVELLTHEQARESVSIRGLEHAASFSWEKTAALTREVYEEVIRRYESRPQKPRPASIDYA